LRRSAAGHVGCYAGPVALELVERELSNEQFDAPFVFEDSKRRD
jgi:hypothetical protein